GGPVGSRHRQQLNGEFIAALLRDFRHGGPKAIERVRRTQPAAYLKILALLCPREQKVAHSNVIKSLSDQELEAMIEYLKTSLEAQAGAPAQMIEGTTEPMAVEATAPPALEPPKPKDPGDAGGRPGSGPGGAPSAQDAPASGRVISPVWRVVFFEREDLPCGAMDPAPPSSVPPKILESVGRHFGVPDGVLDVLVA